MSFYQYDAGWCNHCGANLGLVETQGGRHREYCDAACRQAAYRERKKGQTTEAKHNATLSRYRRKVQEWRDQGVSEKIIRNLVTVLELGGVQAANAALTAIEIAVQEARERR